MRPAGGLLPFQHSEGENRAASRLPANTKEKTAPASRSRKVRSQSSTDDAHEMFRFRAASDWRPYFQR